MNRLRTKYLNEVKKQLKDELKISSDLAVPRVEKIVINVGSGEAKNDEAVLNSLREILTALSGQKPVTTRARKSIAAFKLTQGAPIGLMVSLRGDRMYAFLDKLINAALPKVRDFRGVSDQSFDPRGNFNLGLREQSIFPEVDMKNQTGKARQTQGLQVTIATSARNKDQGKRLLELMGMPFRR